MDSNETREFVTTMLANALSDKSVLAPHVARAYAEAAMSELLAAEFLIADGKIHSVVEADFRGEDASGESDQWYVYTHQDPDEGEETFPSETDYHERAGVDEDGVHYEKGE